MAVIFESIIKLDNDGKWFIELNDTLDNKVGICKDLEEFSQKIEEFGAKYGGHIDEVKWSKEENVPPHVMDEIRFEMSKFQEEIEKNKVE